MKIYFIFFERQNYKERWRNTEEGCSILWFTLQTATTLGLGQAEIRAQRPIAASLCPAWAPGTQTLGPHCTGSSGTMAGSWTRVQQGSNYHHVGCSAAGRGLLWHNASPNRRLLSHHFIVILLINNEYFNFTNSLTNPYFFKGFIFF